MQKKVKSFFDKRLSILALIALCLVMIVAALGIKFSSNGPVFYKARKMGKDMKEIYVYKFRTMKVGTDKAGAITKTNDKRIFPWEKFHERLKLMNCHNYSIS